MATIYSPQRIAGAAVFSDGTTAGGGGTIALAAADCTQANTCSTGAVTITAPGLTLAAADCAQANTCSTGAVTITAPGLTLAAANCAQANTCTGGAVTIVLIASSNEPVTLQEAKIAARLDLSDAALDTLVLGLITAARQMAEHITGRLYVPAMVRIDRLDWPACTDIINLHQTTDAAVSYWTGSTWAALAAGSFEFAAAGSGTALAPALGTTWPTLGAKAIGARVRIDLTAGAATAAVVPACVKLYIKACVAYAIDNPSDPAPPRSLALLLDSMRVY